MATTLASVNVRIGARIEELQKGLKKAERELLRSGRQMARTGQDFTRSLTLPIAAAGAASLKFASDFEDSFLKINTLVGVSGGVLDQFKKGIGDLSGPLGASQKSLSDALFVITSAGQRGADALETLEAASKASAIGLGETTAIARAAVAAQQAYGKEVLTSTDAVDKFTAIVRAGNLEAEQLAPALGKVLPLASQLGVSFDEVGANIATFTRLGVPAAESVTALRSLLSNLIKPSKQAAKQMAKLGISADELRESVAQNGLAATLQQLITAYDGNVEGLSRMFGNVEGLANALGTAGAQGEDYLKIVNEIANSNGIVNEGFEKVSQTASFKLKQSLVQLQNVGVELGGTLIPIVTDLLDGLRPLLGAFNDLSPSLKKVIVSTGLLAAAAGPAVSLFGNLKVTVGQLSLAYKSLAGGLSIAADTFKSTREVIAATGGNVGALTGATKAATAAWKSFNAVTKASIIGLTVVAVTALVAAIDNLVGSTGKAAAASKALNEVNLTAEKNITKEKVAASQLISVLNDNTASYEDKKTALDELNRIAPTYFKGLSIEKSNVDQINDAYDKYVDNLLKAAKAQAAQEKIVELEKRRLEVLNEITNPSLLNKIITGVGQAAGAFGVSEQLAAAEIGKIDAQIEALSNTATKAAIANAKLQNTATAVVGAPLALSPTSGTGDSAPAPFQGFGDSFQVNTDSINDSSLGLAKLNEETTKFLESQLTLQQVQDSATESFYNQANATEKLYRNMELAAAAGDAIGQALFSASEQGKTAIKDLLKVAANAARQFIKIQIAEGVAAQIKSALGSGPLGLFLAPVAAGAAAALFENLVPKFASGGIVREPMLALVGDNPNAATNPEYILRHDQLQSIANSLGGGGGANGYIAETMISGDNLRILLKRADVRANRRSG